MRVNTANRAFTGAVMLIAAPFALLALVLCGATVTLVVRLVEHPADVRSLLPGLAVLALVTTGIAVAASSLGRQWRATRRLAGHVRRRRVATPSSLAALSAALGPRLVVVADAAPFSFTYGLLRPRIVISEGLAARCSADELAAVLEHEGYHAAAYDPLKVLLTRTFAAGAFYLPVLRTLHRRYVVGRELAADRRALRRCGSRPLAGALYQAVAGPLDTTLSAAAALSGGEALEVRLTQLESGREPALPGAPRWQVIGTTLALVGVSIGLAATWVTLDSWGAFDAAMAGGEPGDDAFVLAGLLCAAPWVAIGWFVARRWRRRRRAGVVLDGT
jgi:Zn-dependent protease with chaperone function